MKNRMIFIRLAISIIFLIYSACIVASPSKSEKNDVMVAHLKSDIQLIEYAKKVELYEKEENYTASTNILLKMADKSSPSSARAVANFVLGEHYLKGEGVLQDLDKSLYYYEESAENGDKASVIRISQVYFYKIDLFNPDSPGYPAPLIPLFIKAYAYMKVAQSLPGKINLDQANGSSVNPNKVITNLQEMDFFKPYISEGDTLAKKICLTIPGCHQ